MKALKDKRSSLRSLWRGSLVILSILALAFVVACGNSSTGGPGDVTPPWTPPPSNSNGDDHVCETGLCGECGAPGALCPTCWGELGECGHDTSLLNIVRRVEIVRQPGEPAAAVATVQRGINQFPPQSSNYGFYERWSEGTISYVGQQPNLTGIMVDVTFEDRDTGRVWVERITDPAQFVTYPPFIPWHNRTALMVAAGTKAAADTPGGKPAVSQLEVDRSFVLYHRNGGPAAINELRLHMIWPLAGTDIPDPTGLTDLTSTMSDLTFAGTDIELVKDLSWDLVRSTDYRNNSLPGMFSNPIIADGFIKNFAGAEVAFNYMTIDTTQMESGTPTASYIPINPRYVSSATDNILGVDNPRGFIAQPKLGREPDTNNRPLTNSGLGSTRTQQLAAWHLDPIPPGADEKRLFTESIGVQDPKNRAFSRNTAPFFQGIQIEDPFTGRGKVHFNLAGRPVNPAKADINKESNATINFAGGTAANSIWLVREIRGYTLPEWPDFFQWFTYPTIPNPRSAKLAAGRANSWATYVFDLGLEIEVLYNYPLEGTIHGPRRIVGLAQIEDIVFELNRLNVHPNVDYTNANATNQIPDSSSDGAPGKFESFLRIIGNRGQPNFSVRDVSDGVPLRLAYFSGQVETVTGSFTGFPNQLTNVTLPVHELEGELEFRLKAGVNEDTARNGLQIMGRNSDLVEGTTTGGVLPAEAVETIMRFYDLVFVYSRGRGRDGVAINFNDVIWAGREANLVVPSTTQVNIGSARVQDIVPVVVPSTVMNAGRQVTLVNGSRPEPAFQAHSEEIRTSLWGIRNNLRNDWNSGENGELEIVLTFPNYARRAEINMGADYQRPRLFAYRKGPLTGEIPADKPQGQFDFENRTSADGAANDNANAAFARLALSAENLPAMIILPARQPQQ